MTNSQRLRILILTPSLPYPLIWGFGIRVYQIVKYLAARHDVTLLAYAGRRDDAKVTALRETGARIIPVVRDEPSTSAKRRDQLASLFSGTSFQRKSLESAVMQAAIDRTLAAEDFDIVQTESSQMSGFHFNTRAALLVDEHNIEYELLYRTFQTEQSALRKLFSWVEYRKFRGEEQLSWRRSDGCILTSDREHAILGKVAPETPALVVPNGVDIDSFTPSAVVKDPNSIVFVGVMHYRPNVDAALYFAREILPLLLRRRPDLVFNIVGAGPPEELRRLAGKNVVVTGTVPDTRPYVQQAAAVVVPLRMGSGTRLKVLEGLAMSAAMVSTSLGCEGIAVHHDRQLLVGDTPSEFAHQVLRILDDGELAARLGRAGRALVEAQYSWPSVLEKLEAFMQSQARQKSQRSGVRESATGDQTEPQAGRRSRPLSRSGLRGLQSRVTRFGPALNARVQLRGAEFRGRRVTLRGRAAVSNEGRMTIGDRVRLVSTVATLELATLPGGHLEIGDNVFINYGCSIASSNHVKIGDDCLIGAHVSIMDTDFHRVDDKSWDTTGEPIIIENGVWIGNRAIVLKGITIGHGAVVAAGSVVTHDVPPRTLVAGVPARVVRQI